MSIKLALEREPNHGEKRRSLQSEARCLPRAYIMVPVASSQFVTAHAPCTGGAPTHGFSAFHHHNPHCSAQSQSH